MRQPKLKPHILKYRHGWQCQYQGTFGIGLTMIQAYRECLQNRIRPIKESRHGF